MSGSDADDISPKRQGVLLAALVSGVLAIVFAVLFMSWSGLVATTSETMLAAILVVSAGGAGALTGGVMFATIVRVASRFAPLQALVAGVLAIPAANLAMWAFFFAFSGILSHVSDPDSLVTSVGSGPFGAGTIYLAFASTMLTGAFTVPLSVAGLIGVTLWCRRKHLETPERPEPRLP
ncbi:hypothetical protein ACKTEK_06620 [Tepidamorphus sp. 3E244]|uniref:hypothetical protein n=1 Tax=Tepidamorphus sp. 3E244 TaxID=3385498 RepID=UPI0038FC8903